MRNIHSLLLIIFSFVVFNTACKKDNGPSPTPADNLKISWKVANVKSGSTPLYDASKSTGNTEDFSKYKLKFDGTNYTYTDVNSANSNGTSTLSQDNKTITFKNGALDGKVFNVSTLISGSLIFTYTDTSSKIDRQLTISMVPAS